MYILDHFAVYTRLPIKINQISGLILERGFVDKISFHPIDEDPDMAPVPGIMLRRKNLAPYATGEVADIVFSTDWHPWLQRVVCAKELVHVTMPEDTWTKSLEQVSRLCHGITMPNSVLIELAKINPDLIVDHSGILIALAVLLPRDAREELKPLYPNKLGDSQIAALCEIPEPFIPIIMDDSWGDILEKLCPN